MNPCAATLNPHALHPRTREPTSCQWCHRAVQFSKPVFSNTAYFGTYCFKTLDLPSILLLFWQEELSLGLNVYRFNLSGTTYRFSRMTSILLVFWQAAGSWRWVQRLFNGKLVNTTSLFEPTSETSWQTFSKQTARNTQHASKQTAEHTSFEPRYFLSLTEDFCS